MGRRLGDAREHTGHKPTSVLDKHSLLLLKHFQNKDSLVPREKKKCKLLLILTNYGSLPSHHLTHLLWGHPLLSTFVQALEAKDSKVA